jgi:hypothetical protein
MTHDQILAEVVAFLESQRRGGIGSLYEEPYRMDLFKLFAEAYNQGLITNGFLVADRLYDSVKERWLTHEAEEDKKRLSYLEKVHMAWYDWQYAWLYSGLKQR